MCLRQKLFNLPTFVRKESHPDLHDWGHSLKNRNPKLAGRSKRQQNLSSLDTEFSVLWVKRAPLPDKKQISIEHDLLPIPTSPRCLLTGGSAHRGSGTRSPVHKGTSDPLPCHGMQ